MNLPEPALHVCEAGETPELVLNTLRMRSKRGTTNTTDNIAATAFSSVSFDKGKYRSQFIADQRADTDLARIFAVLEDSIPAGAKETKENKKATKEARFTDIQEGMLVCLVVSGVS